MPDYKEFKFVLEQPDATREILIALLSQAGFEGFVETDEGFLAYTNQDLLPEQILTSLDIPYQYTTKTVVAQNWNKTWEQQIKPLIIDNQIYIKTSFHPEKHYPYIITIDPKMSFGTGHHETTYLMIRQMLNMDFTGKSVVDMGAGTGVLSILAEMLGATEIYAIDNDKWAYENMLENFEKNNTSQIKAFHGDAQILTQLPPVDIFLANINRNILLNDLAAYNQRLKPDGQLVLSGFYTEDMPLLVEAAEQNGMVFEGQMQKNNWVSLKFKVNTSASSITEYKSDI